MVRHPLVSCAMVLLVAAAGPAAPALGQCYDAVEIIGPWCCGEYARVSARAINNRGEVAGSYECCDSGVDKPFRWSLERGFESIPLPPGVAQARPADINDSGVIVGLLGGNISPFRPFVFAGQAIVALPIPENETGMARAINDDGVIVGRSEFSPFRAAAWVDGAFVDIGAEWRVRSEAYDINSAGVITGHVGSYVHDSQHALIWHDGEWTLLDHIPGGFTSEGIAINDAGHVAGRGRVRRPDGSVILHGFFWDGESMQVIEPFGPCTSVNICDMNHSGQVVGRCSDGGVQPFVWQDGEIIDLNAVLDEVFLAEAWAINDLGQIVGEAGGLSWLLTPRLPSIGDLSHDCHVDSSDLILLLNDWGLDDSPANLDGSGAVDAADLAMLLADWGS